MAAVFFCLLSLADVFIGSGLSAFALTTFVLSLINCQPFALCAAFPLLTFFSLAVKTNGVTSPQIVIGLALGYGGLVQLLAGMWEFVSRSVMISTTDG